MTNIISNELPEQSKKRNNRLLYVSMLIGLLALSSCGHETVQEAKQDNISKIIDEIADNEEDIRDYEEEIRKLKEKNRQLRNDKSEREAR